ncbi:MAG: hypothetical protein KAS21_07250 [Candidatus Aminicenantes bacterium]|nr:hypothetical protein [Candidatus Aminicenantes bacterium]
MKTIKKLVLAGLLIVLSIAFFTSQVQAFELQKKYIASDTKWVIHLDFKAFIKTRLWDSIYDEKKIKIDHKNKDLLNELNFNILKDLYSVSVYGVDKGDKNAVVLINGDFDRKKIIKRLESEEKPEISKYGNFKVYHWDDDDFGAFVNNNLLVITHSRVNMEYALDVIKGKKPNFKGSDLSKRMREIPGNSILFALAGDLSKLVGKHNKSPIMINKAKMALFLAMEQNSDMRLSLKLQTESIEAAKNIMQIGNGLLALARMSKKDMRGKEKIINSIQISSKGNIVEAKMFIPSDFIIDNIDKH